MNAPTSETQVPSPFDVRDLLEGLLGRDVDVRITDPFTLDAGEHATYAVYVDDRLRTRAVALADLPLSAYAGAAIALVPAPTAVAAIEAGALDESLAENFHEVLNVCAATLNAEGRPHVKLHAVYAPGSTPPADVVSYASVPGRRLDLAVDVARYGSGRFAVVCVD
jgi:hypothetical protein